LRWTWTWRKRREWQTGERAERAGGCGDENEHTRDEVREMATDIMATSATKAANPLNSFGWRSECGTWTEEKVDIFLSMINVAKLTDKKFDYDEGGSETETNLGRISRTLNAKLMDIAGERAKRASLDDSSDESREMATDIMAAYATKLTLFHSILLTRLTRFALASFKNAPRLARRSDYKSAEQPADVRGDDGQQDSYVVGIGGERAKRASLEGDEHTRAMITAKWLQTL